MDNEANANEEHAAPDAAEADRPHTWHERNGATIMGAILAVLLAIVILNQVAC